MTEHPGPRSLWAQTSRTVSADDDLPAEADVAIAGAGLAGVATALILSRGGHRVVVFDAAGIGARTTGASTAKLSLLQGTIHSSLRRRTDRRTLRAYGEAQRLAQEWIRREVHEATGIEERRDAYTYATTAAGDDAVRAEAEASRLAGLHPDVLGAGDIGLPFPVTSALRLPDQSQLHPLLLLDHLVRKARSCGALFVGDCRLTGVRRQGDGLRVETSRGGIRAGRLVVTTGFPVIDRSLLFAKLVPSRQIVGTYRLPDTAPPPPGMFLSVDAVSRSSRTAHDPQGAPVLLAGGDAFVPGREQDTRERLDSLDRWVTARFDGAARTGWWAAQDYLKADHRPFFGPVPSTGGRVLAATGFGKWGMTNAVAAAIALAARIDAVPPDWAVPFSGSGVRLRGAGGMLTGNASVAREMLRGWLSPSYAFDDLPAGTSARVRRRGPVPVAESTRDGVRCVVSGVCTHLGGVLRWNTAEGSWDCPLHGSRFSPTGRVLEGPATRDLPRLTAGGDVSGSAHEGS